MTQFLFEPRYEWIEYPDGDGWEDGWHGFKIRLRTNPSGGELRHEDFLFRESNGPDLDKQDEYMKYIAPRVIEWNLVLADVDGNQVDVPPPAENWESFMELPTNVMVWIRLCVHRAHLGPKVLTLLQGMPLPADVGTTDSTQPTPLHQAS